MIFHNKLFIFGFSFLIGILVPIFRMHSDTASLISEAVKAGSGISFDIDYISPFGPIPHILLILANHIFNNIWISYLFISGIQNIIFSYLIFNLTIKYCEDIKLGVSAALITAIWFTPQVGGYYFDNLAIIFGILSFNFIASIGGLSDKKYDYFLSSLAMAVCLLIKQNTFLVTFIPTIVIIIIIKRDKLLEYLIYFSTSTVLILFLYDLAYGNALNFIKIYLESIINYQQSTQRLGINNLISVLIYPYNIQLIEIFKHKGIIVFAGLLSIYYLFSLFFLKDIISRKINYIVLFFGLANILSIFLVGRGISNTQYFLGIIFVYLFNNLKNPLFNKFIFNFIIFSGILLLLTGNNYIIKSISEFSVLDYKRINSYINVEDLNEFNSVFKLGDKVSVIGGENSNIFPVLFGIIPTNSRLFYNNLIINDINKNLLWQKEEIKNIKKYKPKFVVLNNNNFDKMKKEIIIKYLGENYQIIFSSDMYYLFRINEK